MSYNDITAQNAAVVVVVVCHAWDVPSKGVTVTEATVFGVHGFFHGSEAGLGLVV
jgi:hypothetical protein